MSIKENIIQFKINVLPNVKKANVTKISLQENVTQCRYKKMLRNVDTRKCYPMSIKDSVTQCQ